MYKYIHVVQNLILLNYFSIFIIYILEQVCFIKCIRMFISNTQYWLLLNIIFRRDKTFKSRVFVFITFNMLIVNFSLGEQYCFISRQEFSLGAVLFLKKNIFTLISFLLRGWSQKYRRHRKHTKF